MSAEREPLHCAGASCTAYAFLRIRYGALTLNVCRTCYAESAQRAARDWCAQRGLSSPDKQREYVASFLPRVHLAREPGED